MTLIQELSSEATAHDLERGWTRESVGSLPELRDPDLLKPFARAYLANQSLSVKDTRTRKIVGQEVADGEIARLYLKRTVKQALERRGLKVEVTSRLGNNTPLRPYHGWWTFARTV